MRLGWWLAPSFFILAVWACGSFSSTSPAVGPDSGLAPDASDALGPEGGAVGTDAAADGSNPPARCGDVFCTAPEVCCGDRDAATLSCRDIGVCHAPLLAFPCLRAEDCAATGPGLLCCANESGFTIYGSSHCTQHCEPNVEVELCSVGTTPGPCPQQQTCDEASPPLLLGACLRP